MDAGGPTPQQSEGQGNLLLALNVALECLNLAKEISSVTPAKAVFSSVIALLSMIRVYPLSVHVGRPLTTYVQDTMANRKDYLELGLACAGVCKALNRGMNGRQADQFSESVFEAIEQLTA